MNQCEKGICNVVYLKIGNNLCEAVQKMSVNIDRNMVRKAFSIILRNLDCISWVLRARNGSYAGK